ncbi:hypothetical protein AAIA71_28635 (plasmid) [Vibrio harveyi]|uniref:hypothetical protein n=1 Tax=Vibrio harveyi TaxID=669 RepID=UPI00247FB27A|nr:hypothetical protein [Vibrio harveyi]
MKFTFDGDLITSHYREKAQELGLDSAVENLMANSDITKEDAVAVLSGTKRFGNDDNNNIVVIDETTSDE